MVGVAKTAFHGATFAVHVMRGNSKSPLFVTARGVSASDAALHVKPAVRACVVLVVRGVIDAIAGSSIGSLRATMAPGEPAARRDPSLNRR